MSNNLILAAAVGYNFNQIELFVKSLRKYYSDKICLIIDSKDLKLQEELAKYRCEIVRTNIDKKKFNLSGMRFF